MESGKKYTVQLTVFGLSITDEKGQFVDPYHTDRLLRMWNKNQRAWVYLCYGYSKKVHAWCYKIGFTNDVNRRMQQLGFDLVSQIVGTLYGASISERHLQGYFIEKGKWLGGEYFDLSDKDIDLIKSLQSFKDVRNLTTSISWDYIARWNREAVTLFKAEYVKGVTYAEWYEKKMAQNPRLSLPYVKGEA